MIEKLIITGGQPLNGEVTISGAKNSATKLMIASLLTDEPVVLYNMPHIGDVEITKDIIEQLGAKVKFGDHTVEIETKQIKNTEVAEQTRKNRISVLALGPLLHRAGEAKLPIVGGDNIGARPVNYHLEGLRTMGAEIEETPEGYTARAESLKGTEITLPFPSVGATENILLAAVLAKGRTRIHNAATEPEVNDLVMLLQRMGAIIEYRANRGIVIDGVDRLHGTAYTVMPDRLEAASYASAAIATGGKILVKGARQQDMVTFLNTVRRLGAIYHISADGITFKRDNGHGLKAVSIKTDVWPGFSTDWQQPLAVALTQANGKSVIHETVYEDRFGYTESLVEMGADIELFDAREKGLSESLKLEGTHYAQSAAITGPVELSPGNIEIPDIRAGMAYVIAALTAKGQSTLTGVDHLMRGYDDLLGKLEGIEAIFETE